MDHVTNIRNTRNRKASINSAMGQLILAMVIYGTIGIFRRFIPLPSSVIACSRGIVGAAALAIYLKITKRSMDWKAIRKSLLLLCLSGALMGANWVLLFEAYQYTSVSVATVCYYMAPVFVIMLSPLVLKERLTLQKVIAVILALAGLVCVSGVIETGVSGIRGVLLGLGAAILYASVICCNKFLKDMNVYDRTILQLLAAGITVGIYAGATVKVSELSIDMTAVLMLVIVCTVHTGYAYALYFGSFTLLPAQTVAIFGYIDPIVSLLLSALILSEKLTPLAICGVVLVLGGTIISELRFSNN